MKKTKFLPHPLCNMSPDFSGNSYWTIKREDMAPPKSWGVSKIEYHPHHLLEFKFVRVKDLMRRLRELGWKPSRFKNSDNRFARVRFTRRGFRVTFFDSYSSALRADAVTVNAARTGRAELRKPGQSLTGRTRNARASAERAESGFERGVLENGTSRAKVRSDAAASQCMAFRGYSVRAGGAEVRP